MSANSYRRFRALVESAAYLDYATCLLEEAGLGNEAGGLAIKSADFWEAAQRDAISLSDQAKLRLISALENGDLGGDMSDRALEILGVTGLAGMPPVLAVGWDRPRHPQCRSCARIEEGVKGYCPTQPGGTEPGRCRRDKTRSDFGCLTHPKPRIPRLQPWGAVKKDAVSYMLASATYPSTPYTYYLTDADWMLLRQSIRAFVANIRQSVGDVYNACLSLVPSAEQQHSVAGAEAAQQERAGE